MSKRCFPSVSAVTFFAILDNATKDYSVELLCDLEKHEPRLKVVWAPEK